jgi:hypothetical protein
MIDPNIIASDSKLYRNAQDTPEWTDAQQIGGRYLRLALLLQRDVDLEEDEIAEVLVIYHRNVAMLDFQRLGAADDFTVVHDVYGVVTYFNPRTANPSFRPRCLLKIADPTPSGALN